MNSHRRKVNRSSHRETQVRIPTNGVQLAGILHRVEAEAAEEGVVVCPPFGDERKSAWGALTHLARTLTTAGYPVVQFDYWGCGESEGAFLDASLSTRLRDVSAAADYLRRVTAVGEICLLGLRLGATLATQVASERNDCASMVLVEPIVETSKYYDRMMQRKKLRQMITAGKAKSEESGRDIVDLDGYAVRRATLEDLQRLEFDAGSAESKRRTLLVQVSFNQSLSSNIEKAVELVGDQTGGKPSVKKVVLPPFWSRVDLTDTSKLNGVVRDFMIGEKREE
jgi:alpha/beta superfamily hydrolase